MVKSNFKVNHLSNHPLVSIIIPTYNHEKYLEQAINSVLSQDYPNFELLVLNDGSTDKSEEILRKYIGKFFWETHTNMGEYRTIDKGFNLSKGEYILILSSDDYLLPGSISSLVRYFQEHPKLAVVYPDYDIVDDQNNLIQHIDNYQYCYENSVRWFACMPGPAALLKRELYSKLGGRDFKFRYVGDFDFYLRAGLLGEFSRVPATLACYRWHAGSQTQQKGERIAKEHLELVQKFYSQNSLPLNIRKLKRESTCSAYYIAGVVCSENPKNWLKRWYYLISILYFPSKYCGEYKHRWSTILKSFWGNKSIHSR